MKRNTYLLLLSFLTVCIPLFVGCKKEKLTEPTQQGANTFSCKVNGKVFIARIEGVNFSGGKAIIVQNSRLDGFIIEGTQDRLDDDFSTSVTLKLPYLQKTGSHALNGNVSYGLYSLNYSPGPQYKTNSTYTGTSNITRCDTINQIYSGTFSFTAIDNSTGQTVKITDGRFDAKR